MIIPSTAEESPYFAAMKAIPLLSKDEERALGRRIAAGRTAETIPPLERTAEHLRAIVDGQAAQHKLVTANLRWATKMAHRFLGKGLDEDDLIQYANIGLIRAAEKFDIDRNFTFLTYATWWVRQSISRALDDHGRAVRLPVHAVATLGRIRRVIAQLTIELERQPTIPEIAARVGKTEDVVEHLLMISSPPASLNAPVSPGADNPASLEAFIADDAPEPGDQVIRQEVQAAITRALASLPEREALIVRLRFGIGENGERRTLEQVGAVLGMTRERARQIEKEAFTRLRTGPHATALRALLVAGDVC